METPVIQEIALTAPIVAGDRPSADPQPAAGPEEPGLAPQPGAPSSAPLESKDAVQPALNDGGDPIARPKAETEDAKTESPSSENQQMVVRDFVREAHGIALDLLMSLIHRVPATEGFFVFAMDIKGARRTGDVTTAMGLWTITGPLDSAARDLRRSQCRSFANSPGFPLPRALYISMAGELNGEVFDATPMLVNVIHPNPMMLSIVPCRQDAAPTRTPDAENAGHATPADGSAEPDAHIPGSEVQAGAVDGAAENGDASPGDLYD